MQEQYLARHSKVWKHTATGQIYGDRLTLKEDEKLTDYQQISKPQETEKTISKPKTKQAEKPVYSFGEMENKNDKGVF